MSLFCESDVIYHVSPEDFAQERVQAMLPDPYHTITLTELVE